MSSVLVLDDRPADRELLTTLLGYAGYNVLEAATGEEALEVARAERPDLIITDILMPTMNGYEFVRELRSDPGIGSTPVVFCTANYAEGEVRRLAEACGVSHFISKPSEPETIIATVGEVLGLPVRPLREVAAPQFDHEQLRVQNDKLVQKIAELEYANEERRRLVAQVLSTQEEERRRIADDIHDGPIQGLTAATVWVKLISEQVEDATIADGLESLGQAISRTVEDLRQLLFALQPVELERQGLGVALQVCVEHVRMEHGLACELENQMTREPVGATAKLLYRAGQEALANAAKHAEASNAQLLLDQNDGEFLLRARDDGKGFDPEHALRVRPGHLGLPALRERIEMAGGVFRLESRPGAGSTLEVRLPEGDAHEDSVQSGRSPWFRQDAA
jgi:signal transduction histidine kinase